MTINLLKTLICVGGLAVCTSSGAFAQSANGAVAKAELLTTDGQPAGVVELVETPNGVLVTGELRNIETGEHGFHIHETGTCEPDFAAAGDHFAPRGNEHGFANTEGFHAGDMPNVFVNSDGLGSFHFFNQQITLSDGEASINDDDGGAIVVHASRDSYLSDAQAGDRVACGVITMAQ